MPMTEFPGVYIEEVPTGAQSIEGVSTSTAGFIGRAPRAEIAEPRIVHSFGDYERRFGGIRDTGTSTLGDALSLSVQAFFANGGTRAWIAPLARRGAERARYTKALASLDRMRDIAMICLPGVAAGTRLGAAVLPLAIAAVEKLQSRMLIVDPPSGAVLAGTADVEKLRLPASSFAALYYPWVKVRNPYAAGATRARRPAALFVPPSGFAAGVWARSEAGKGVWAAPAGADAVVRAAQGLAREVTASTLRRLAPVGVNGLRALPTGIALWGARTLAPRGDHEWKYVNVRRLAIFIERSIATGMQWALFEPNAEPLWARLRDRSAALLVDLWRQGALPGRRPEEAFWVRCDRSTMTQHAIDAGLVIVTIGFAPLKPSEFVVVRIGLWTADRHDPCAPPRGPEPESR